MVLRDCNRWLVLSIFIHILLSFFILFVQSPSIDVTEQPEAPTVRTVRTEQTSISLSWEVSKTCFESVDFKVSISWRSASGNGQATNVSGSSYDITGLTPGVSYHITLVAIGDGVRSDNISISATTLSSGEDIVNACHLYTVTSLSYSTHSLGYCERTHTKHSAWDPRCCCSARCGGVWECHLCPRCQGAQTEEVQ